MTIARLGNESCTAVSSDGKEGDSDSIWAIVPYGGVFLVELRAESLRGNVSTYFRLHVREQ